MVCTLGKGLMAVSFVLSFLITTGPGNTCGAQGGNSGVRHPVQPYTAEFKITTVTTLANGTTIKQETKQIRARDSSFRTLDETISPPPNGDGTESTVARVHDPVESADTTCFSPTHQTVVQKLPPVEQQHGCWQNDARTATAVYERPPTPSNSPALAAVKPLVEPLGTSTIDGIEVRGQRITQTVPAGAVGNDQPLSTTTEIWTAPSLGLEIKSVTDDPRRGKITRELLRLDLNEPDPAIFRPPSDYHVTTQEMHQVPCEQLRR